MGELFRRLRYLLQRRRMDEELVSEMEFHREMAERAGRSLGGNIGGGGGGGFGNTLRLREEAREAWGWTWIERLGQDLRYAARTLARSPGFTATAVLVLGIGIGVNVAAFSLFNLAVLRLLPIRHPETIVRLQRRSPDASTNVISYQSMLFYRTNARSLSAVMGTMGGRVAIDDDPQPIGADFATANYYEQLGEQPLLGQFFGASKAGAGDAAGASPVAVLSYGLWQRKFGGDPGIVGRTIHLNRKPVTVIGVEGQDFASLGDHHPDVRLPLDEMPYLVEGTDALTNPHANEGSLEMWGRLAPGVTRTAAQQELQALTEELRRQRPGELWDKEFIQVDAGGHLQVLEKDAYLVLSIAGALAVLILAVACANLGGLLLARGVKREREIGIRLAIGASRGRIFRQLLTESLLLASLGAATGLGLGYVVLRVAFVLTKAPGWMSAAPDWRVLIFMAGMALLTTVFFGLAPALQIARQRQRKTGMRQVLVAAQVAASGVLLIVAGLLVRAAQHAVYSDPGFGYEQVISIDPGLGSHGYTDARAAAFLDEFAARLRAVPGVSSVALSSKSPLSHERMSVITNTVNGRKVPIHPYEVGPEFFGTMGIPLLSGRNLLPREKHAVIVSQSMAQVQWPVENPLGKRDASGSSEGDVVVGVAGNARLQALEDGSAVELYHAAQVTDMPGMVVIVQTAGASEGLLPVVKALGESMDPKLYLYVRLLKGEFRKDMEGAASIAWTVSLLGMVAVSLAALGLIGLVVYAVSERTKEIAIRLALGANRSQVLSAILRQFVWPVAVGLVAGAAGTALISRVLRQALYGISNLDPLSYGSAMLILVAIIALAALVPARKALRVDLARTLHYE